MIKLHKSGSTDDAREKSGSMCCPHVSIAPPHKHNLLLLLLLIIIACIIKFDFISPFNFISLQVNEVNLI